MENDERQAIERNQPRRASFEAAFIEDETLLGVKTRGERKRLGVEADA
jgi:hypothetical protein